MPEILMDASTERKPTKLTTVLADGQSVLGQVRAVLGRLRGVEARLFGETPTCEAAPQDSPTPPGILGELNSTFVETSAALEEISQSLTNIETAV